jgi:phospholipid-translocating ATPase
VIAYVGHETKLSLNSKESGNKFGEFDRELNLISKILFTILLALSAIMVILRGSYGTPGETFILLFKFLLLLCSIIPISMRVNLDFARLLYKMLIDYDPLMPGCQCRNSNIPE